MSSDLRSSDLNHADAEFALRKSVLNFVGQKGKGVTERTRAFFEWVESRRRLATWPYSRVMISPPCDVARVANEYGGQDRECINFGSQDYLGLARDARVFRAARQTIENYGVHSAGSPALAGRTGHTLELEHRIAELLGHQSSMLFATGWAAGFGVV